MSKKDIHSEHVAIALEKDSKGLVDTEVVTESNDLENISTLNLIATPVMDEGDDIENISSMSTPMTSKNNTTNATITFITSEVPAVDSNGTKNNSYVVHTAIGVGVGCAVLVALLSFSKRQR